jgi:hypothetical protein
VYQLWYEITETMRVDDETYNSNITLIEQTCHFIYDTCLQLRADVTALQKQVMDLQRERNETKQFLLTLSQQMQEQQKQIAYLQANQTESKGTLDTTVKRVDKLEELTEFKTLPCVYVMYCKSTGWYKIGSSHHATGRESTFKTANPTLELYLQIPTATRESASSLETTLHKYFDTKRVKREWFNLDENDLTYLRNTQENNIIHLSQMSVCPSRLK